MGLKNKTRKMVEVFKVEMKPLTTSYHGSKEAAIRRAEENVMRYSKYSGPDSLWVSKIYRAKFPYGDPDAIAEDLQLGNGNWLWPERQDLIATKIAISGILHKCVDGDEDKSIIAMRRVFYDDVKSFQKMRDKLCVGDFTAHIRQTATLYKPLLTLGFYKEVSEVSEQTSLSDLSVDVDVLCGDVYSALDDSDKVMKMARRVYELSQADISNDRFSRLASSLLKAMLDARKQ